MTWGFPTALYFAAVAIPVIAVFLYRRRSRVVDVPSSQIWTELGRPVEVRSFRSLLRRLLSLLLQLLLIATLVAALADPLPQGRAAQRTILVLDASFTMQTQEGAETRMDLAKRKALAVLGGILTGGEVVILQAAHCPLLTQPLTRDLQMARQKIEAMDALDVEGDLQGTVELAGSFASGDMPTKLVVISDFASASPKALMGAWNRPTELSLLAVGEDRQDAAITSLWSELDGGKLLLQIAVGSKSMSGRKIPVQLSIDGRLLASQELVLDNSPRTVKFTAEATEGSVFEVALKSDDALAVDDRAWGVVGTNSQVKVCLVSSGNVFLECALRAGSSTKVRIVAPAKFTGPEPDEVVIFDGSSLALPDPGCAAGYLFIGTSDPFGWTKAKGLVAASKTTHWSSDHPCMADIDPTAFRVSQALQMDWPAKAEVQELIGSGDMTLVAELSGMEPPRSDRRPLRCVYWLFDLRDSDLPRRLGFPILLWNTIDFLSGSPSSGEDDVHLTGRPLVFVRSSSASSPVIVGPRGNPIEVRLSERLAVASDTIRTGVYRRQDGGKPSVYAVNLLSSRALQPLPPDRSASDNFSGRDVSRRGGEWLGRYARLSWESLILASVLLALLEWLLFTRRIVRVE